VLSLAGPATSGIHTYSTLVLDDVIEIDRPDGHDGM